MHPQREGHPDRNYKELVAAAPYFIDWTCGSYSRDMRAWTTARLYRCEPCHQNFAVENFHCHRHTRKIVCLPNACAHRYAMRARVPTGQGWASNLSPPWMIDKCLSLKLAQRSTTHGDNCSNEQPQLEHAQGITARPSNPTRAHRRDNCSSEQPKMHAR